MKQLAILKIIYDFLKTNTATIGDIINYLQTLNITRSDRQVKRDLKDVSEFFLNEQEQMIINAPFRANQYQIIVKNQNKKLSQKTINTLSLAMAASPNILVKNRKNDIDYLRNLVKHEINTSENSISFRNFENQIANTNFYEIEKDALFEKNIDKLIEAISTQSIILISKLKNDYTVDNHHQTTAVFEFIPLKIIYHRGAFLIAGFLKSNTAEIVLYEISQLEEFTIRKEKFNLKDLSKTLNDELDNRFGITKNIDDKVYDIKLEFTNITGSLVRKYTWHHSQKFILYEGNYIMTLKCGINRELLGWIFQWMYNVRILEPQQLIDVYKNSLVEMQSNRNLHTALKYKNIFEPKL